MTCESSKPSHGTTTELMMSAGRNIEKQTEQGAFRKGELDGKTGSPCRPGHAGQQTRQLLDIRDIDIAHSARDINTLCIEGRTLRHTI